MQITDITGLLDWVLDIPLWQRYKLTKEALQRSFEQALANDDLLLIAEELKLVAKDDKPNGLCGFAWVQLKSAFGRSPYLRLIGVKGAYQRQGIARQLLETLEASLASSAKDLFLLVSDFNLEAQRFYQNSGYKQIGSIPTFVLEDVSELIYYKKLYQEKEV